MNLMVALEEKIQKLTKVVKINNLETINGCTQLCANPTMTYMKTLTCWWC